MTTTINASPSNGIVQTADGSGILKVQSNGVTTNALAWVNFNGTGTVAIRSSYNVSSITDNGTGDYTVNFATALSDANYAAIGTAQGGNGTNTPAFCTKVSGTYSTSAVQVLAFNTVTGGGVDQPIVSVAIFGN